MAVIFHAAIFSDAPPKQHTRPTGDFLRTPHALLLLQSAATVR